MTDNFEPRLAGSAGCCVINFWGTLKRVEHNVLTCNSAFLLMGPKRAGKAQLALANFTDGIRNYIMTWFIISPLCEFPQIQRVLPLAESKVGLQDTHTHTPRASAHTHTSELWPQ